MPRRAERAWASPESARSKVLEAWGGPRLRVAEQAWSERIDANLDRWAGELGSSVLQVRRLLARTAPLVRELVRLSDPGHAAEPLTIADVRELGDAISSLDDAHQRLRQLAERLEPKALELVGETPAGPHHGTRAVLVRAVLERHPSFPRSASEWAYFAIAVGLDEPAPDAITFATVHRKRWDETIRSVKTGRRARALRVVSAEER